MQLKTGFGYYKVTVYRILKQRQERMCTIAMNLNSIKDTDFLKENQIAVRLKWKPGLLEYYC